MLVGASILVAQLNALESRRQVLSQRTDLLENRRMEASLAVAHLLKILREVPPLALLSLISRSVGGYVTSNLGQQGNILDVVQNMIAAMGTHAEINPTMHSNYKVVTGEGTSVVSRTANKT